MKCFCIFTPTWGKMNPFNHQLDDFLFSFSCSKAIAITRCFSTVFPQPTIPGYSSKPPMLPPGANSFGMDASTRSSKTPRLGRSWKIIPGLVSGTVHGRNPAKHLGSRKAGKYWDKLSTNWCRISSINSSNPDLWSMKRPLGRGIIRSLGDLRSPWLIKLTIKGDDTSSSSNGQNLGSFSKNDLDGLHPRKLT